MTAPYYQKAANVKDLAATLAEVAEVVPEMPFFYYHIPCLTNVNFPMYDLLVEMDKVIPNLGGIKYTFENMMDYQMCLYYKDHKYNIMWGRDEMLLEALAIGADTFIGSTYGYNAPVYNQIIEAFNAGDMKKAADLQYKANVLITFLGKYGNGTGKAFMKAADMDLGPVRRPFRNLTEQEYEKFLAEIKAEDFDLYKCVLK
jgi:N-acetylneuraminate lyase